MPRSRATLREVERDAGKDAQAVEEAEVEIAHRINLVLLLEVADAGRAFRKIYQQVVDQLIEHLRREERGDSTR